MLFEQLEIIYMDNKLKGDIAERVAVFYALKRGWGVLKPIGNRLSYDKNDCGKGSTFASFSQVSQVTSSLPSIKYKV